MDYLRVGLVIAPQFLAGCLIYLLLLKRREVDVIELASIGSVFGIVSSTIVDQIFVNLKLPHIGWLVAVLLTVAAYLQIKRSKKFSLPRLNWGSDFRKSVFAIMAIAAMALGTEWFWLFPSGVLFVIASSFLIATQKKYSKIASGIANLCAVVAGIYMIANRPKIWWFLYDSDYAFLQALSRSLADWGLSDYLLLSGTDTKYHWFSYAWIGLVDRSSGASTFFVLTRIAPVLFVLLITCIIWKLINQFSTSILRTFASTLVIMTASSYSLWGGGTKIVFLASPSHFYAFAFLFATIYLLIGSLENRFRIAPVLIAVFSAITVLSKTMHGVILICAISFALISQLVFQKKVPVSALISGLLSVGCTLVSYFFFVSNSEARSVFEFKFGDFFWQLQGDARLLPERHIDLIAILTISGFAVLPILLVFSNFNLSNTSHMSFIWLLSIGSILSGSLLSLVILGAFGENLYFIHVAIVTSTVLGFAAMSRQHTKIASRKMWVLLTSSGVCLALLSYAIPNINSGAQNAILIRSMRVYATSWFLILVALILFAINLFRQKSSFNNFAKLVIASSAMVVTFSLINWSDTMPRKHSEFSRDGASYLASLELEDVANWINENSKDTDIVASNFGWPTFLPGDAEFFRSPCTAVRNKDVAVETCKRTNNALLVAYMHRRTWLQATSIHYTGFTPEIDSRQTVTLGFTADPTPAYAQQMLDDGVDWFVVDRSTSNRTTWEPYATIEYTNDSFFALRLNKNN
jgi:hypothetical protein